MTNTLISYPLYVLGVGVLYVSTAACLVYSCIRICSLISSEMSLKRKCLSAVLLASLSATLMYLAVNTDISVLQDTTGYSYSILETKSGYASTYSVNSAVPEDKNTELVRLSTETVYRNKDTNERYEVLYLMPSDKIKEGFYKSLDVSLCIPLNFLGRPMGVLYRESKTNVRVVFKQLEETTVQGITADTRL